MVLGAIGPGAWSLDDAFGIRDDLVGWPGILIAVGAGVGGAGVLLAATWRPPPASDVTES
jgi:putative oxidoreductase